MSLLSILIFFFFNDTATTEIYTLSLHDALPISSVGPAQERPSEPKTHSPPALEFRLQETFEASRNLLKGGTVVAHRLLATDQRNAPIVRMMNPCRNPWPKVSSAQARAASMTYFRNEGANVSSSGRRRPVWLGSSFRCGFYIFEEPGSRTHL